VRRLDWIVEERGSTVRVKLAGELDISSAGDVEEELKRIERGGPELVVLDLREVRFIDSTGLRMVVTADSRAREGGWRFSLVRGPEAVQRVFRITRLDDRLDFVEDGPPEV
jgi:anti-sigma B factor antagonist